MGKRHEDFRRDLKPLLADPTVLDEALLQQVIQTTMEESERKCRLGRSTNRKFTQGHSMLTKPGETTGIVGETKVKVSCPWQPNLALTRKRCEDCPRDHICCVCDGEDVCVPPVFKKPGVCPRRRLVFGHCMKSCSYDGDCPNNNKCCSTGCGRDCMAPVIEHCPWRLNLSLSHKGCKDCPRDHICCVYNGEDICIPPVPTKPGFCPQRRMCFGHCSESCSYDSDCPDNEKCCSNGCGHVCMAPAVD
ncbi:whey acidic protein-like [Archocentrus centrarchus]|uniref:whey acidic protein-like n=1 Tax=Archocentrus centrarchus TaxID=63155 RepID=UPI0011EA4B73|nr:whey acidic protein-like [Archocentrus centrarchus]